MRASDLLLSLGFISLVACTGSTKATQYAPGGTMPGHDLPGKPFDSWQVDFTKPVPAAVGSNATYDASVIHPMNYSISERDTRLNAWWSKTHVSELCFPTAFANALIYLYHYHVPTFGSLKLAGLSGDKTKVDPAQLVESLLVPCHTNLNTGTDLGDATTCIAQTLTKSGYQLGDAGVITLKTFAATPALPLQSRAPTWADIRSAVDASEVVILEIGWYQFDSASSTWQRKGGHYVGVYGYDYMNAWGSSQAVLRVLNPEMKYDNDGQHRIDDRVTMVQPSGTSYPPNAAFVLLGNGFSNPSKPGVVESVIHFVPN